MTLQEKIYFFRQLLHCYSSIGALIPTSHFAAQSMSFEFSLHDSPCTILEVGPGTGAITAAIIKHMKPEDQLVLCEINLDFIHYLRWRFENDLQFVRVRDQVTMLHMDVNQIDRRQSFDFIISSIPFTNYPSDVIEATFNCYREILKPNGVLTYIEYAYLRLLKSYLIFGESRCKQGAATTVLNSVIKKHQFRCNLIYRNFPPAWVRSLCFNT